MAFRLCILGSGSSGNATLVASDTTRVLVDAGLSARELQRRLGEVGASADDLKGVCVSHEHADHIAGLRVLQQRHGVDLFANAATREAIERDEKMRGLRWTTFTTGMPFELGDIRIEPFSVPHDAYDPVGFVLEHAGTRVGIVTDIGVPTQLVRERLRRCQAIVIEANHDESLLRDAQRPWHLKQRIMGRQGHLSNERAAAMLAEIASPSLTHVYLAHLSEECNREDIALATVRRSLDRAGHAHIQVRMTYADRVSDVCDLALTDGARSSCDVMA